MAIDSAEKRLSISGITMLLPGVTINASPDVEWRQESGWSYSGIEALDALLGALFEVDLEHFDGSNWNVIASRLGEVSSTNGADTVGFSIIKKVLQGEKFRARIKGSASPSKRAFAEQSSIVLRYLKK